jgi:hypothetical protein
MTKCLFVLGSILLATVSTSAQQANPKPYTYEDYCTDNPHAPACNNGKPLAAKALPPDLSKAGGYCVNNAKVAGCSAYCKDNPKAFVCVDMKPKAAPPPPGGAAAPAAPAEAERDPNEPTFVVIPDPPVERLPGSKTLSLPASWRFAHPHAEMMMAVNLTAVRRSSAAQVVIDQVAARLNLTPGEFDAAMEKIKGADHYWVSMDAGDTLILMQGKMDYPTGFVSLGDGTACYRISRTAVVLGREASVAAAVRRLQEKSGPEPAAVAQVKQLSGEVDLWMQGTRTMLAKLNLATKSNAPSSYLLAASFHGGLKIDLQLNYATADQARRMLETFHSSPISSLQMSSEMEDTSLRVRFAADQAVLSTALGKIMSTPPAKQLLSSIDDSIHRTDPMVVYDPDGGTKVLPSEATPPPPPGKMVIYGLPGGPRIL